MRKEKAGRCVRFIHVPAVLSSFTKQRVVRPRATNSHHSIQEPNGARLPSQKVREKKGELGSLLHQYARRYSDEPLTFGGCSHAGSSTGLAAGASP